jgi:hypothetical protein
VSIAEISCHEKCAVVTLDAQVEASLAQSVEQLIRNEQVVGSSPTTGSSLKIFLEGRRSQF